MPCYCVCKFWVAKLYEDIASIAIKMHFLPSTQKDFAALTSCVAQTASLKSLSNGTDNIHDKSLLNKYCGFIRLATFTYII